MIARTEVFFGHLVEHYENGDARIHARQIKFILVDSKNVRKILTRRYSGLSAKSLQRRCRNDTGSYKYKEAIVAKTKARNQELLKLHAQGWNSWDLSEHFNVSRSLINQVIKSNSDLGVLQNENEKSSEVIDRGAQVPTLKKAKQPTSKRKAIAAASRSIAAAWSIKSTRDQAK